MSIALARCETMARAGLRGSRRGTFWQTLHYHGSLSLLVRYDSADPDRELAMVEKAMSWRWHAGRQGHAWLNIASFAIKSSTGNADVTGGGGKSRASPDAPAGRLDEPPAAAQKLAIQKTRQYIVDFVVALKFSILVIVKRSMFDDLDRMPDIKIIQKQFLYVLSALLFIVSLIALVTVDNYADNAIDTIRSAVCDRIASVPNSHSSCYDDGHLYQLSVEKTPSADPVTLGALVQVLWEALALSQSITGYAPWLVLPKIFDYVVLPWVMPLAAGFIVSVALLRQDAPTDHRLQIRRYATYLMMSCVAVPLLLLAPVQALNKTFEHAELNFPNSASRLTGPGYSFLEVEGKSRDEVSAIFALEDLVVHGRRATSLIEYALFAVLAALCLRMVLLLGDVMGRKSMAITGALVGIFAIVMALLL